MATKLTDAEVDDNFKCPILSTVMRDPVVASDGHTYERAAIQAWLETCEDVLEPTSPMTGFKLKSKIVFANHALRRTIMQLVEQHPEVKEMMSTDEDIAAVANRHAKPLERSDTPPLIDLRTEEEIAAAEAEKENAARASASIVPVDSFRETGATLASAESSSSVRRVASYTLATPSSLFLTGRYSYHERPDEMLVWEADGASEVFQSRMVLNVPKTRSANCSTVLRLPSRGSEPLSSSGVAVQCLATATSAGAIEMWRYERSAKGSEGLPELKPIKLNEEMAHAHPDTITCLGSWPHSAAVCDGSSSPLLLSGSRDKTVRVWKSETLEMVGDSWEFHCEAELEAHSDFVQCLDVEVGSGMLLSGGADWKACLWDLHRLDAGCISEFEAHSYPIRCCAWSTSGQYAVNGFEQGAGEGNTSQTEAGQPSGAVFATGGDDEMVYVVDPRAKYDGKVARLNCGAAVLTCCWGPTDEAMGALPWFAAGGGVPFDTANASSDNVQGWVRVWDPRMWKAIGDCCSHEVTPIIKETAVQSSAKMLRVAKHISAEGDSNKSRLAHMTNVTGLSAFRNPHGKIGLVSVGGDQTIRLWKLPRGPGGLQKPVLWQNVKTRDFSALNGLQIFL